MPNPIIGLDVNEAASAVVECTIAGLRETMSDKTRGIAPDDRQLRHAAAVVLFAAHLRSKDLAESMGTDEQEIRITCGMLAAMHQHMKMREAARRGS